MATIEEQVEVNVPVRTAYNQWTQFEEFPRFMEGVERVEQKDTTHLHWVATVGGKRKEWDAEITEQQPDRKVAWRATSGAENGGQVTFESLGSGRTRVKVRMDVDPEGIVENLGQAVGVPQRQVKEDLERFKEFIESRGSETGAWRGEVDGGDVKGGNVR
jgi:uncharacterized membrane protein